MAQIHLREIQMVPSPRALRLLEEPGSVQVPWSIQKQDTGALLMLGAVFKISSSSQQLWLDVG